LLVCDKCHFIGYSTTVENKSTKPFCHTFVNHTGFVFSIT